MTDSLRPVGRRLPASRERGPATGRSRLRLPVMAAGLISLVLGLWAGLFRLGWALPLLSTSLPEAHGPLMVNGVLATLIGLERAVALHRRAYFAGPFLTGAGSVALALGIPSSFAIPWVVLGGGIILAMFLEIRVRQPALHTTAQVLGAGALLAGNVLWWGGLDIPYLIPWWGSFLVLLIAAERLELTRMLPIPTWRRHLLGSFFVLDLAGCAVGVLWFVPGTLLLAGSWIAMALWLIAHDVARWNLRRAGLPRFAAICLLSGYAWLAAGGALILAFGGIVPDGLVYDAQLHAVFLGFVLSMIFAHAFVILPATLGTPAPFHRAFYVWLGVLDASLMGRIAADLLALGSLRAWAGLFNVVAIGGFGISLLASVLLERWPVGRFSGLDASSFFP